MSANERTRSQQPLPQQSPTIFYLMARHNGAAVVPVEEVVRDYFGHLSLDKFNRKILAGTIDLPIIRSDESQKSARGVHIADLAAFIDRQRQRAIKECEQLRAEAA